MLRISPAEKYFIEHGVEHNVRNDGRGRLDYRHYTLETGINIDSTHISQTNGSARLKLGNTDILVGVKAEIGEPSLERPDEGKLQFYVECCPSASPEFEGRGAEYLNVELARFLERIFQNTPSFNLQSLCVVPGQTCWNGDIDALVLDSGGNLFDSLSLATLAALYNTKIPSIKVDNLQGNANEGNISRQIEIEVSDDPEAYMTLDVTGVPVCVTLTKIGAGNQYIVDADLTEEMCMSARISIAINRHGKVCAMQKGGNGGFDAALLPGMLKAALAISKNMIEKLDLAMDDELKLDQGFHLKVGFFA